MKVKDVMTHFKNLITCDVKDNIQKICQIFQKNDVGSIIVFQQDEKTIGIITKSDIIEYLAISNDLNATANDLMKIDLIYCQENDDVNSIAELMYKSHIHHMLVKNESNIITGIISSLDVAGSYTFESNKSFFHFFFKK